MPKPIKYVIHEVEPRVEAPVKRSKRRQRGLAGLPEDVRDAAALATHAIEKGDRGDCDGGFNALEGAYKAFGRAEARSSGAADTEQVDKVHVRLQRAKASVRACYRKRG